MEIDIIAEIGQAHEGSLGILHSYIDAIATTGANAIKFQTHIAEAESSPLEPFRVKFSLEDDTRYDYWNRMEFTKDQWMGIKRHCDDVNLEFLSSPFSIKAVDLLEEVGVKRYKIGSGEVSNLLLLDRIADTGKPVILSSGLSDWDEIEQSIAFLQNKNIDVSLVQCTTSYPTTPEKWGLNVISEMKKRFDIPIGFSDHSGTPYACPAAICLGASIIEFHAVFDKRMFGPDATSSLTIDEITEMVKAIRMIQKSFENPMNKEVKGNTSELKRIFGKSLALNRDLAAGETIKKEYLESKKPAGEGIDSAEFERVIGKTLKTNKSKWSFLNDVDLS
ncbi:MAG: N-acetylneuraminate synthase family protein [Flavobacteriales bacterium]|nr:N-acetylneuraminate synthase family protein [Flavobacteriales bacterium]